MNFAKRSTANRPCFEFSIGSHGQSIGPWTMGIVSYFARLKRGCWWPVHILSPDRLKLRQASCLETYNKSTMIRYLTRQMGHQRRLFVALWRKSLTKYRHM